MPAPSQFTPAATQSQALNDQFSFMNQQFGK